jgi:GNAT superfamily N-acetyltransferase
MLLAEAQDELLAFTTCGESRDEDADRFVGELRSFFVAAGRWGQGVGRALMAAALDSLRERGCTEATVWSFAANERANGFYERAGFRRDGAERTEDAWAHLPEVRYRRPLSPGECR